MVGLTHHYQQAVAVTGKAPYKGVLSHGFALDGEGRKMSKSVGNVIVPAKVNESTMEQIFFVYGLHLLIIKQMYVYLMHILKQVAEVYRKIRNTFRFLLGNLDDFNPETDVIAYAELT